MSLWEKIEKELNYVSAPSQYIGAEHNSINKDHSTCDVKFAIAYPDAYKIGMSCLGVQLIYGLLNQMEGVVCERVFAPMPDMEYRMRKNNIPLFSLESHTPAREFDILGFSLQSELVYTNVLNMLDLAGITLRACDRREGAPDWPLIIAGGPCAFHPEAISDFIDLFVIGEGEAVLPEFIALYRKVRNLKRNEMLFEFATKLPGIYVPSLYQFEYRDDGTIRDIKPQNGAPPTISKVIAQNLQTSFFPTRPIVPWAEVVHDRINLEIMRGCPHHCRFCQAVNIKNRLRTRPAEQLLKFAEETYKNTGYNEIALTSLSSGDYPDLPELMVRLNARFKLRRVSLSLPSLKIDKKLNQLPALVSQVRKSGFTLAPEAGTQNLRNFIGKPIKDEDIFDSVCSAIKEGWKHVKLYFIIGLPGEMNDDMYRVIDLCNKISALGLEIINRRVDINVSISPFVPKPHTPFQWHRFCSIGEFSKSIELLKTLSRGTRIHLQIHDPAKSFIETVLGRGDRRLCNVLFEVWKSGCKFDEWGEFFDLERYLSAFKKVGIDPTFYTREIPREEVLPWDHINAGVSREYLLKEFNSAVVR
jgi:radical SAM family uncharacterized protein